MSAMAIPNLNSYFNCTKATALRQFAITIGSARRSCPQMRIFPDFATLGYMLSCLRYFKGHPEEIKQRSGREILAAYKGAAARQSCMTGRNSRVYLYALNPEKVRMVTWTPALNGNMPGNSVKDVMLRALLWYPDNGPPILDRVYLRRRDLQGDHYPCVISASWAPDTIQRVLAGLQGWTTTTLSSMNKRVDPLDLAFYSLSCEGFTNSIQVSGLRCAGYLPYLDGFSIGALFKRHGRYTLTLFKGDEDSLYDREPVITFTPGSASGCIPWCGPGHRTCDCGYCGIRLSNSNIFSTRHHGPLCRNCFEGLYTNCTCCGNLYRWENGIKIQEHPEIPRCSRCPK